MQSRRAGIAWWLAAVPVLATFLIGSRVTGVSGDFVSTTWRTEEGLPHSAVNSIVQTHDGYLWIGTYVGLVRFDGARFVHHSMATMPQLGPGRISRLFEDRNGVLWIGLESGRLLALKDGSARIHLPNSPTAADAAEWRARQDENRRDRPMPNDAVISMAQDGQGTIWLQTANGNFGRLTSDSVEFLAVTGPSPWRSALGLAVEEDGTLWVGTRDGLRRLADGKLVEVPGLGSWARQAVDAFARARPGGIWFFRNRILRRYSEGKITAEIETPQFEGPVVEILECRDGRLWLAAANGALVCREGGHWRDVAAETGLRGGNKVLIEDKEGNVWRGSFGGGLTRIRPKVFTMYELPEADFDRYALGLTADGEGNVWMLLNGRTLGRMRAGHSGTNELELWHPPAVPTGLRTIYADSRGTLWLGLGDGRVGRWKNAGFSEDLKTAAEPDFVHAFFEDAGSNVWVGFSQGAGVGRVPRGEPSQWQVVAGMPYPDVRAIAQAADGAMWFGTHYGGAFRWQNGRWTKFTTRDGLVSDYVRCLKADADGTMWLGTMSGLCRYREGVFKGIRTENGLWHNALSAIVEDHRGNFWMSSFGGVFRVARQELNEFADGKRAAVHCVGYNRNDGLPALESPGGFQPAGVRTTDGRLWFPTVDGVAAVDPEHVVENKVPPPVMVEEVAVDGAPLVAPAGTRLEIPAGKRRIEFRFTALSFTAPEKVRFQHQLQGLDGDWSQPDDRRLATYNFVPPGRYTFQVKACNSDGVWNHDGAALGVEVKPWSWQTWWFKAGLGLALAAGLALAVRQRERVRGRARMERLEREHALERERSRIAQDIHDDVGASLTQIVFLSERVRQAGGDATEVGRWNQRVASAARQTIQSLDEIVWAVSPENDTLESLANYLARFAQEHLSLAGVRCVLDVMTVAPPIEVSAELRHNLLLGAREALQNAVAHARATEVRVGLELREDELELSVADDGQGFEPERAHPGGHGLLNLQRRIEGFGGRTEITSQKGRGTMVRFTVPRGRLSAQGKGQPTGPH